MTMADLIIEQFKAETAELDLDDEMGVDTYQVVPLFLKNITSDAFATAAAADPDIEDEAASARTAASARARVRAVFDLLVREGTSGLSADDLTTALARLDIKLSAAKTRWLMEKMDVDGDGTIGFDEVVGPRVSSDDDVA